MALERWVPSGREALVAMVQPADLRDGDDAAAAPLKAAICSINTNASAQQLRIVHLRALLGAIFAPSRDKSI
jgi:hypothetical protein